jgi:hypothetical protein
MKASDDMQRIKNELMLTGVELFRAAVIEAALIVAILGGIVGGCAAIYLMWP